MMMMMMMMLIQRMWNFEDKIDTGNDRGNWNHFGIIHKTPQERTGEALNQVTTESTAHALRKFLM